MSRRPNFASAGANALGLGGFSSQANFNEGRLNSKPFDGFKTSGLPSKNTGLGVADSKNKTQQISIGSMEKDLMRDIKDLDWELDRQPTPQQAKRQVVSEQDNGKIKPKLFFKKEEKKGFNDTGETKTTAELDEWDLPVGGLKMTNNKPSQPQKGASLLAVKKPAIMELSERSDAGDWDISKTDYAIIPSKKAVNKQPVYKQQNKLEDVESKAVGTKNIKTNVNMELEAQDAEFEKLYQCPEGCGRSFKRIVLEKHIKVCKAVFQKELDTKEASLKNRGVSVVNMKKGAVEAAGTQNRAESVKKWKKDSEQFRKMLKGGKKENEDELPGAHLHKPEEPQTVCDICQSSFNQQAYSRHRPLCESKKKYKEGQR